MISRTVATNSTPEVSGAKRRNVLFATQIPRRFDITDSSTICAEFEPIDWIAILQQSVFFKASDPFMLRVVLPRTLRGFPGELNPTREAEKSRYTRFVLSHLVGNTAVLHATRPTRYILF